MLEQNEVIQIPIEKLRVHAVNETIYVNDDSRQPELLRSIKEHGILEPLVVTEDGDGYTILSGARRLDCAKELGTTLLPCIVVKASDPVLAIIEHNRYRQKTPIEIYNEAQVLRSIIEPRAKAREEHREEPRSNLAQGETGRTRDIIAEKLNVSAGYLSMLEQVMEHKEEIPEVVKRLEAGRETVYSAYSMLKSKVLPQAEIPSIFIGHYFAGKQAIVREIVARIPSHDCYVEPFGGFCSVLLNKPPSKVEVYNDISKDVVNLLLCIRDYPLELISRLQVMPYSRYLYEQLLGILDEPFKAPDIERAAKWYYLNESTFAGIHEAETTAGNWAHGITQNYTLRFQSRWPMLLQAAQRLYRVQIENRNYEYVLDHYDGDEVFFYLDPPYYGTDQALGISWAHKQHEALRQRLGALNGKWLLTYNDSPIISELYEGCKIEKIVVPKNASDSRTTGGLRQYYTQLLITNYPQETNKETTA